MGAVIFLLVVFFFKEKPPTPPSRSSAELRDADFMYNMKEVLRNKNMWNLASVFGLVAAVLNVNGTIVGQMCLFFDFQTVSNNF